MEADSLIEDMYATLRLEKGHLSTESEIKKAYRKRALESHPDKRPGDKKAAEEFNLVQRAYELLSDQKAREAYDEVLRVKRARVERDKQRGSKRQKLVDELIAKEKVAEKQKNEEDLARQRLKAELERIRRKSQAKTQSFFKPNTEPKPQACADPVGVSVTELERTLKVSWTDAEGSNSYSVLRLKAIFSEFGEVEDIVIREGRKKTMVKKKKKHSALVVMATSYAAQDAVENVCGDFSNPLKVTLAKNAKEDQENDQNLPAGNPVTSAHATSARASTIGSNFRDFESLTFMKMRQAIERERLIKELKEKEREEEKEKEEKEKEEKEKQEKKKKEIGKKEKEEKEKEVKEKQEKKEKEIGEKEKEEKEKKEEEKEKEEKEKGEKGDSERI